MNHISDSQVGIHCVTKAFASPGDQAAHQSTITGCSFEGTGLNARGIWLRGRENVVTGCSFRLSGTGSEGINVDDAGGSFESNLHVITGCNFFDAQFGINIEDSAEDILVTGCMFSSSPFPYTDNGTRSKFSSNHITDCTDGVTVLTSATDPVITDNTIDTASSEGIVIASGVTRAQLYLNYITNATTAEITDAGTATAQALAQHFFNQIIEPAAGAHTAVRLEDSGTEFAIPDAFTVFGQYANGSNVWVINEDAIRVKVKFTAQVGDQPVTFRIRLGTNRLGPITSDTEVMIQTGVQSTASDPTVIVLSLSKSNPDLFIVPDEGNGDELYITAERTGGVGTQDSDVEIIGEDTAGDGTYVLARLREQ
jgi:hypothetical protein